MTAQLEVLDIHLGFDSFAFGGDVSGLKKVKIINSKTAWCVYPPVGGFPALEDIHLDGVSCAGLLHYAPCLTTVSLGNSFKLSSSPSSSLASAEDGVTRLWMMAEQRHLHLTLAPYMDPHLTVTGIPATHLVLLSPAEWAFDWGRCSLVSSVEHIEMHMSSRGSDKVSIVFGVFLHVTVCVGGGGCGGGVFDPAFTTRPQFFFEGLARMTRLHTVRLVGVTRMLTVDIVMACLMFVDLCSLRRIEVELSASFAAQEVYDKLDEMAEAVGIEVVAFPTRPTVGETAGETEASDESAAICID